MKLKLESNQEIKDYYNSILKNTEIQIDVANKAKKIGVDPSKEIETKPVTDLADRTESIIGPPGVAKRYRELYEEKQDRMAVIFQIFEEILNQDWCKIPNDAKRVEQAIKTALVLNTEGVVVAPLDGVPKVIISENSDSSKYIDIYYAGPIRAAGGTSAVLPLILGDYARKILGLSRYLPTKDEVERYVEEVQIYSDIVSRQYKITDEEVRKIIEGCPVCINGEPTEQREVAVHRNIKKIGHNRIRGGMCLVVSEGVALKAMKILKFSKILKLDWNWLEDIIKYKKSSKTKKELEPLYSYLEGAAAGRPILSYPSRPGGFRLRYGRSTGCGIMAKAVHPATMYLLDEFIAIGTQIKVERPGKAGGIIPCDSIEGPIVKLKNGDVVQLKSSAEAIEKRIQLEEVLFEGDILIPYGDFKFTAHPLVPVGFCEEWWALELEKKGKYKEYWNDYYEVDEEKAIEISKKVKIPLHPKYTSYFNQLSKEELEIITKALINSKEKNGALLLENKKEIKGALETAGILHKVKDGILIEENVKSLTFIFGNKNKKALETIKKSKESSVKTLSHICGIEIKDKGKTFIGVRMGRPEASGPRQVKGNPHVLFPIGNYGGNIRSINKAIEVANNRGAKIEVEITNRHCKKCNTKGTKIFCEKCLEKTVGINKCFQCSRETEKEVCPVCKSSNSTKSFQKIAIDIDKTLQEACQNLGVSVPKLVKGVKGMINKNKIYEPMEKGILRARQGLSIFKDGTIRYEAINNPLTHFSTKEIGQTIKKMKELGYTHDYLGNKLEKKEQIIEIFPQDIILEHKAGDFFLKVTKFLDEELEKLYKQKKYYNATTRDELIGHLFLGLAPHTSAAIIGRLIGYSPARACLAHPYYHQTKRRNCLSSDTPVLLEKNARTESISIGDLDTGEKKEEIPLKNTYTYTVKKNGKLKKEKVTALFKKKAPKHWLKIKTMFGRELKATKKQKILVRKNGKTSIKYAKDLKTGDKLLSLRDFPITQTKEQNEVNVLEWYKKNAKENQKKNLRIHGLKKHITQIIEKQGGIGKVTKKLNWRKNNGIKSQKKAVYNAIYWDAIPLDLFEKLETKLKISKTAIRNSTISYNKQKSKMSTIISLTKELGEIIGYYLGDGHSRTIDNKKRKKYVYQICFVSAEKSISKKLSVQMEKIFNRKITKEKRTTTETLVLSGRVYYDFFKNILNSGTNAKNKRVPVKIINSNKECIEGCLGGYITANGNIDKNCIKTSSVNKTMTNDFGLLATRLGIFPHLFQEKKREIKIGLVKKFYGKKKIFIQSCGLRFYFEDFKKIGKLVFGKKLTKVKLALKNNQFRKKRINKVGNFVIDKIVSIEKERSTGKYVYDLIVNGEKTFIAGFGSLAIYDCDGDQDSVMLMMDGLLNFSHSYLPESRGGRMDAPLVFTIALNPIEIDDECHNMEICSKYPLELYEKAFEFANPDSVKILTVKDTLGTNAQYTGFGFTHTTTDFNDGPTKSKYVQLKSMADKIKLQAKLQSKIKALDKKDALERVMATHFFPDIVGNTRAFSRQKFRCTACNAKYRRPPLNGKCNRCANGNLILTIAQGSVRKYLLIAKEIIREYELSDYLSQRIELVEEEIDSIFKNEKQTQTSLAQYI